MQIGLSTDKVVLTAGFSGTDLTIFGALVEQWRSPATRCQDRATTSSWCSTAKPRGVVVRRKERVLGMWINTKSENLRQCADLLFHGDDAHAAGHHRSEKLSAVVP